MKRTLLMVMAVALLLTQCRKPAVELPTAGPANENMVSMTVTVGHGGKTDINGTTGAITWSENDKLYVGDGTKYIGCLTLQSGAGSATGTFTGSVSTTSSTTFGLYYLGSNPPEVADNETSVDIPFGTQTGLIDDLSDCHIGYGTAKGRVDGTSVILDSTDPVTMTSKVAIAYFEFKDGETPYKGAITLSGTNICNSMTVGFNGSFAGKEGTAGKAISLTNTESSQKYVMLVPTGTGEETLNFGNDDMIGTTKFYKGIEANKFYCVGAGEPIAVTVKPIEFTVNKASGTTVTFAPGNLYYDGSESKWKFESNQWDFRTYNDGTKEGGSCIGGVYSASSGTPSGDWGLFGWSGSNQTHYGKITSQNSSDYSGEKLKDWGGITDLPDNAGGKTWHTLSNDEWKNLLGTTGAESPRDDASSLREWVTLDNGVSGLVILPDGSTVTASSVTTTTAVATSGAVFLPAAGGRGGTGVNLVGSCGYYWSSTPNGSGYAYIMLFTSDRVKTSYFDRNSGSAVRLVR